MAKTFLSKRTSAALAVMRDAIDHARKDLQRAEKQYGQAAKETAKPVLVLGFLYYLIGEYEKAEPLLLEHVAMAKEHFGENTRETLEGLGLLFQIYVELNRMGDVDRIANEANAVSRNLHAWPHPPLVEALLLRAERGQNENEMGSRQRGFALAVMSLCWSIFGAFDKNPDSPPVMDRLRLFLKSYTIGQEEWEWIVKHARLNRHDFVGMLSILLHHTGLAPRPLSVVAKRVSARSTRSAAQS
jgi:tetratricopeptide (TPR) repeat protein